MAAALGCEVVVPVYNGHDALVRCLAALARHTPPHHPVWLVDDASTDARVLPLLHDFARRHPAASVVENASNLGFVGAVNAALAGTRGDVVLLNADTEVTQGWIEGLERCRDSAGTIGIVCPLSNNATLLTVTALSPLFAGNDADAIGACVRGAGPAAYPRIPTAVGFCMLVTRALLDAAGPLDAAYGRGYGEENDLSMRALQLGFEIACCDDVYVHHEGEASFGEARELDAAREANRRLLERRWPAYAPGVSSWMRANPLRPALERINAVCERERLPGRPRVLHVTHAFDSHGGVEQHLRAMMDALGRDVAFNVLVPRGHPGGWSDLAQERIAPHVRVSRLNRDVVTPGVHVLEFRAGVRDAAVEEAFARFMAGGYDVAHFHSPLSWNTLRLPRIAHEAGAGVVLSMHDMGWMCADYNMVGRDGRPCGKSVARGTDPGCVDCLRGKSFTVAGGAAPAVDEYLEERFGAAADAMACADAIVCPSRFMAARVAAAFGADPMERVRVIGHGVHDLRRIYRPADRAVLAVAYVGRFSPQKGGQHFLDAARRLEGQGIVFEVWGAVDERLRDDAARLGVALHGDYEVPGLADHLRGIDLVVIPTPLEESFCLALSEVQALGIPVAAARSGAIPERVRDGEDGFLFEPGDTDGLARLLLRLRDDRRALAAAGEALARMRPKTLAENAAEYLALYRELAARPRPAAPAVIGTTATVGRFLRLPRARRATPLGDDAYDQWLATQASAPAEAAGGAMSVVWMQGAEAPAREINRAVAACGADWAVLVQAGDRLAAGALALLSQARARHPRAALLYGDEDAMSVRGERYDPALKPAFCAELLRHRPYVAGVCAVQRETFLAMGGLRIDGWLGVVDLALRLAALEDRALVAHAGGGILVHRLDANIAGTEGADFRRRMNEVVAAAMRRAGAQPMRLAAGAGTPPMWAHCRAGTAPITVVLRTQESATDAVACLQALMQGVAAHRIGEVFVDLAADQASPLVDVLGRFGAKALVQALRPRGGDALAEALRRARGEWIAVVDARCRAFTPGWLERLEQGIAGPFTAGIAPDVTGAGGERISGAQVVGGGAWSVAGAAPVAEGNSALALLYNNPREVSCLSPHLSLWRREAVNAPGVIAELGRAGRFDVAHLSLMLRARGQDLLVRPFVAAQCAAAGGAPGRLSTAEADAPADVLWMRGRWKEILEDDPCFHRALSLTAPRMTLAPRFPAGRREGTVRVCAFPFDRWGSGEVRVRQPCAALERSGLADVVMMDTHDRGHAPNGLEWRRLGADTLLAHNFFHDYQLVALDEYAREGRALRVLGLDDLLTELPPGNPYAATIYPDIAQRIARARSRCDRLVVSTHALAEAYGRGIEVHVVPNALDPEAWGGLENRRHGGERVRIGWAGARQHRDDLRILETVVAATHRDVDWVFLGMCPASLRRYAAEFHEMVPVADYPATLASLALDAAVAPLADNPFNRAKSDLKILEYGVLGIPVIASDIGSYHETPALLAASADDWIDLVRSITRNVDRAHGRGKDLRDWVLTKRMLPSMLPSWRSALNRER